MQPNKKSDMYIRGYSNAAISFDYIPDFSNKQEKMDFEEGLKDGYNKKRNFMDSTTLKDLQRQYGSDQKIGQHLHVARQTVFKWRKKLGIPACKFIFRNTEICQSKLSASELSMIYKLSKSQIYSIRKRFQ